MQQTRSAQSRCPAGWLAVASRHEEGPLRCRRAWPCDSRRRNRRRGDGVRVGVLLAGIGAQLGDRGVVVGGSGEDCGYRCRDWGACRRTGCCRFLGGSVGSAPAGEPAAPEPSGQDGCGGAGCSCRRWDGVLVLRHATRVDVEPRVVHHDDRSARWARRGGVAHRRSIGPSRWAATSTREVSTLTRTRSRPPRSRVRQCWRTCGQGSSDSKDARTRCGCARTRQVSGVLRPRVLAPRCVPVRQRCSA